ncbi:hypothetical protein SAY86_001591 [Trapa natans]|uniref:non-specific serine/threonine protein kinase n=1 Tax=Trapa natans TaxID=22666 RepID=A0AAN7LE62_TRANT|nr:hypothetical protein SAY86_001591 [Trapa natans]
MNWAAMASVSSKCEITELTEDLKGVGNVCPQSAKYAIEDDINCLFESIKIRNSIRASTRDSLHKNASKRPMRGSLSPAYGIGISEPVSLKQALRGLCISQASEMAAMKRLSKPVTPSGHSEAGAMKSLYKAVVIETNGSGNPVNKGKANVVEITLGRETVLSTSAQSDIHGILFTRAVKKVKSLTTESHVEELRSHLRKMKHAKSPPVDSSKNATKCEYLVAVNGIENSHPRRVDVRKSTVDGSQFQRPAFSNKRFMKKLKREPHSASCCSSPAAQKFDEVVGQCACEHLDHRADLGLAFEEGIIKDRHIPTAERIEGENPSSAENATFSSEYESKHPIARADEGYRPADKVESSQSSKSSIGDYRSTTATSSSESSNLSSSSHRNESRPHMSKNLRWEAIGSVRKNQGTLNMKQFKLLKRLGCGDIGDVYLAELMGTSCLFALKVMDSEFLKTGKKMLRAQTEKEIMQMLDHPFLPTLYYHFSTEKLSCLVMEYCPGGDLHVLRQKQPARCFSEHAARFYLAEVLLALEYLHMLGVVYRDLKPENVLIREDGHIMLSDFDLSLRCAVNPIILTSSSPDKNAPPKKVSSPYTESSCIDPFCLHRSWQVNPLPQLVVEPTSARSNSFVGTYEYLAPEIVKGEGHGSSVDWWTFGIFLFELLYGRTPFKGSSNEETLSNVVSQSLIFPGNPIVSFHARDLIRGLLVKDSENRLGSIKGAAEIKRHPFFEGLNWALIRCAAPPELPVIRETHYAEEIVGFKEF